MYINNVHICIDNILCSDHMDSYFLAETVKYLSLLFICVYVHI